MNPPPRQPEHPAYRPDIDGLRAVAILSVIGFHAFPAWVPGGFVGVDIFFVISGYLISGILLANLAAGHFSLRDFYARRIRRIFPALILVLATVLAVGWFILWPDEYRHLAGHAAGGAGFIDNFLLSRESGYFDGRAETKPLLHLWSLGVEEQFYIFWPLMLWAGWRWKHRAGVAIAGVIATSFVLNIWLADNNTVLDFYSPLSRFWELLAGGALAWAAPKGYLRLSARISREALALSGALLIMAADFALTKKMAFPGWAALLPVTGAVLLIAAGETAFVNRNILANRAAVAIGLISYPLYLWHWPLLSLSQIMVGEAPSRFLRICMVALAFILASLTYLFVERPARHGGLTRKRILVLIALMSLIGCEAAAILITKGAPTRFADIGFAAQKLDGDALIKAWRRDMRLGECHLEEAGDSEHAPDCIETTRPLVFLWGDSHAASLYPGLKELQNAHAFGIAQLTQASCPPLFDLPEISFRKNCDRINERILAQAAALKPAVILLASAWRHEDYGLENADIIDHVLAAVARIRQASPHSKIIVIGPAPRWLSPLPAIYRRAFTLGGKVPSMRLDAHLDDRQTVLDRTMRDRLYAAHIDYLSPLQALCDAQGCLTRLSENFDSLTFIDEEHVSAPAAIYLMHKFAPLILDDLGQK